MSRALSLLIAGWMISIVPARAQYPISPYPYPYYGGTQATTVGQSYAMGMSDMMRAAGDRNLNNSVAAMNLTQAQSQNLDNRLKGEQTYIQMRNMNDAYRAAHDPKPMTTEEAWRYAQMGVPKRLAPNQLDPVTGKIYWPMPFQSPRFSGACKHLDDLFVKREQAHGSISYDLYMQIEQATNGLLDDLQKNVAEFSAADYMQMKNFVQSLAYEARLPAV